MEPTWRDIHRRFAQELDRLWREPEDEWHEYRNTRTPAGAVEQDWALADAPLADEIQTATERWTIDDAWPGLSVGARYAIRQRLNAAADFVFLFSDRDYLPLPPDQTEREIVRWFVLVWWPLCGRGFFAREISGVPEDEV